MHQPCLFQAEASSRVWNLRFVRGRGNSLTRSGLEDLLRFFGARGGDPRPVVLTHSGRSFCTGLDLQELYPLDRAAMRETMDLFHRALTAIFTCPVPVVVAANGHVMAGGALLALSADTRILARGRHRVGIHGVQLGIAYPDVAIEVVRHQLSRREAERSLYTGGLLDHRQALKAGWVDRLVEVEALEAEARAKVEVLGRGGTEAFSRNKARLRSPVARRLAAPDPAAAERWLDRWFSTETRNNLRRARTG